MLISPLMWPLIGMTLGLVAGKPKMIVKGALVFAGSMLFAIGLSALLTYAFSPTAILLNAEITSRISPTLFDLLIALLTGLAGAFIVSWEKVADAAAGVAIASSILLPMTVTGIGLSIGNMDIAYGSFLLFLTNVGSIVCTGILVFLFLGHHENTNKKSNELLTVGLVGSSMTIILLAFPLTSTFINILETNATESLAKSTLETQLLMIDDSIVTDSVSTRNVSVGSGTRLQVTALLRAKDNFRVPYTSLRDMEKHLSETLGKMVQLDIRVLPPVTTITDDLSAKEKRLALEEKLGNIISTFLRSIDNRIGIESLQIAGTNPLQIGLVLKAPTDTVLTNTDRLDLKDVLEKELLAGVRLEMSILRTDVITEVVEPHRDDMLSSLETTVDRFAAKQNTDGVTIASRVAIKTPTGYVLQMQLRVREDIDNLSLYTTSLRNTVMASYQGTSEPLSIQITEERYKTL